MLWVECEWTSGNVHICTSNVDLQSNYERSGAHTNTHTHTYTVIGSLAEL